jgi:periplasmic protein TonB
VIIPNPRRDSVVGQGSVWGAVGLLHLALIYALVNGLGQSIADKIRQPIETRIIQDTKPPPPEVPPPPPPPQFAAPPPPFVPPPEIQLEQPPPLPQHAITAVTHDTPPAPVALKPAAPLAAAPAIPDRAFSAHAISGGAPVYPDQYADSPRPGNVTVSCTIQTDGRAADCKVLSSQGGAALAEQSVRSLQPRHPQRGSRSAKSMSGSSSIRSIRRRPKETS